MTDRTELRRLLEMATPRPWEAYRPHPHYRQYAVDAVTPDGHLGYAVATTQDVQAEANAELIATAVNALPALLDAAAERDRLAEAVRAYGRTIDRWGLLIIAATHSEDITTPDGDGDWEVIESRLAEVPALLAERDALAAKLDAVRALHGPRVLQVLGATCSAEECDHEDACPLVDYTVCGHCYDVGDGAHPYAYEEGGLQDIAHPCATRRALDATPDTGGES